MCEVGLGGPFGWEMSELVIDWSRPKNSNNGGSLAAQMAHQAAHWSLFGAKEEVLVIISADIEAGASRGGDMITYDEKGMARIFPSSWYSSGTQKSRQTISGPMWNKSGIADELKKQGFKVTTDHPYGNWHGESPDPLAFHDEMRAAGLAGPS